jgi:hypothetical protein
MCCNSNLYYVLYFQLYANFLKFIVHATYLEMVKPGMVKLTWREKAGVAVGWMLYAGVGCCWSADGREDERKMMWRGREGERR